MEIFTEEYEFNPEKKYIHYFDDVIDYQKYAGSERYTEPHVSVHFEEEGEDAPVLLRYNKDVRKEFERYRKPLTFEVLSAGTLYFTNANDSYKNRRNLMYKVNDEDWVTIESGITKQYFGIPEESVPFDPSSVTSSIEDIGTYGFVLCASTGYYTSTNKGVHSSAAVSRITFNTPTPCNVVFNYINYAEGGYDYGVFGNLDANIGTGTSSNNIYIQATNSSSVQTLTYSVSSPGQHFIEVKFRKDSSANSNNDNLQFNFSFTQYAQTEIQLNVGDVIQVKADNAAYGYSTGTSYYSTFNGTAVVKVSGNIMSLLDSERFATLFRIDRPYAFYSLFYQYTGLTSDGELVLPATTLANYCYQKMFYGCSKLTIAPDLPSENLASTCYAAMFYGCTSLTKAPELPATTLASDCYYQMFYDCASLREAPELPATTLESNCYNGMFGGCTGLTTAPELPATTLATSCYGNMFYNCYALTEAPELPATTLAQTCYYNMFSFCTSLTTAPELPATTLANNCYEYMFRGCTRLTTAPELTTTTLANSCYQNMFYNCTSLTIAPELPATTLVNNCYTNMFYGCTGLTEAPELPATTLAINCYSSMFYNCTSLTTAPELPATTLADYCYNQMFQSCTRLTTAPELPATTLATYCYKQMFQSCTGLTTAPELPATTLANNCYNSMFYGCSSLTTAPELPATTLANYCYNSMFAYCASLIEAPELPARTLTTSCYYYMFYNCPKLNYIKCLATNISASSCLYYWTYSVSPTGTFVKDVNMSGWTRGYNGIPTNWDVVDYYGDTYLLFETIDSGTFKFSGSTTANTLSYSLDSGQTWTSLAHNTATPTLGVGQSIMWKGTTTPIGTDGIGTFISAGEFNIKGNPMSLLYGDDFVDERNLEGKDYALKCLFRGTDVVNAENMELVATTLSEGCYFSMFHSCADLISAPKLPSKNLAYACYQSMFRECTSLTEAPKLPATTLAERCYRSMFRFCTNLTIAPELPAKTLEEQSYITMFEGCTSLNYISCQATDISATDCTLQWVNNVASAGTFDKSVGMNDWTTGINGIPVGWGKVSNTYLSFIALGNFALKYYSYSSANLSYSLDGGNSWTSLNGNTYTPFIHSGEVITVKAKMNIYNEYPAYYPNRAGGVHFSTSGTCNVCGNIMSLLYADDFKQNDSITKTYSFYRLFSGAGIVSAEELMLPAENLTMDCYGGMFINCKNLTTAPSILPATTLGNECYVNMFCDCTNLTTPPILPATTMIERCYGGMFKGCTSLTTVPTLPATTLASYCYQNMFQGCSNLTTAPELPATNLLNAPNCYWGMFRDCTSLSTAPALPASAASSYCYREMFYGCTRLTTAPELPATTMAQSCYQYMFSGCTNLTTAPELPATDLSEASYCYDNMFGNCTNLTTAPELPATVLSQGCYREMFKNCISLATASELPATTLTNNCYQSMFKGCTSLTTAPELPATTLESGCYSGMFSACSLLNRIICYATANITSANTVNWTNGVFVAGTFYKDGSVSGWTRGVNGIPITWQVEDIQNIPLTFEILSTGNISWKTSDASFNRTIQYKKNNGEWTNVTSSTGGTLVSSVVAGDILQIRGDNKAYGSASTYYTTFSSTANFKLSGNIMSLLKSTNFHREESLISAHTFEYLFYNCTGLTDASKLKLPATTLTPYCYFHMFHGCANLSAAPELPATTLAGACYNTMFAGCTNLTIAPKLPAETLVEACYSYMFAYCSTLNYIKCLATDISANNCTSYWVNSVASTGTFITHYNMSGWTTGINGIPSGWIAQNPKNIPLTLEILSDGSLQWYSHTTAATRTIQYKKNDADWVSITSNTGTSGPIINVSAGDLIQLRGNNFGYVNTINYGGNYCVFRNTGCTYNLYGNIESLLSADSFSATTANMSDYAFFNFFAYQTGPHDASQLVFPKRSLTEGCYKNMFEGCTNLTTAPELPATGIARDCYDSMFTDCYLLKKGPSTLSASSIGYYSCYGMFRNCYNLMVAPELPATSVAGQSYGYMFENCVTLTTAPELPATTLAGNCYNYMFKGCKGLITGPSILPVTSLSGYGYSHNYCYQNMFNGCTSLTTAPVLPATTLASNCYEGMFYGCTSLTTAPELPSTTLAPYCYRDMFSYCTNLTTAPELPATTIDPTAIYCYTSMFNYCESLTRPPRLPLTKLTAACYSSMFKGCTSLTTAPELPATELNADCYRYMFEFCHNLETAPELPATNLSGASNCYEGMFEQCYNLEKAPDLLATTLTANCYSYMFHSCTKLNYIKCLATTNVNTSNVSNWVVNIASSGTFVKNPSMSSWTTGANGIPIGWDVIDAT